MAKSRVQSFSAPVVHMHIRRRPLRARVLIEMMHLDGRAVHGAPGVVRVVRRAVASTFWGAE